MRLGVAAQDSLLDTAKCENVVVGSGPAGIAAAMALIDLGQDVVMLDVGTRLDPACAGRAERLAGMPPENWPPYEVDVLRGERQKDASGVVVKTVFGDDFPYRQQLGLHAIRVPPGSIAASHARGGLSTVWGAAVLPYNDRDLAGWPLRASDLAEHYRAVTRWMPLMGAADDLQEAYPAHASAWQPARPSRQAALLLARAGSCMADLRAAGIRVGHSRLAMRAGTCQSCGLCLHGCPYGAIYSAAHTLETLCARPGFRYIPGRLVTRLREHSGGVELSGTAVPEGQPWRVDAARVFLGAGVLPSAQIVLASASHVDTWVHVLDSQYAVLPMLATQGCPDVESERLHTLAQVFWELDLPEASAHNIHVQVYTYSSLIRDEVASKARGLLLRLPGFRRHILPRLLAALCYLHSDDSGRLAVRLDAATGQLQVATEPSSRASAAMRHLARQLAKHARSLGARPLAWMMNVANPGRGYHCGGTFPMSPKPEGLQSDLLGRPFGWRRIHVVDASVFPTIPAATITFTAMANAHRIATQAVRHALPGSVP